MTSNSRPELKENSNFAGVNKYELQCEIME